MAPVAPIGEPTLALPPKAESPVSEPGAVQTTTAPASRAGRDLPAAIGVGLLLLVAVLVGLLLYPPAFLAMVVLAAALGVWELSRGLLQRDVRVPLVPMMVGVLAMPVAAYYAGAEGLLFALSACALAILIWRTLDPVPGAGQSIFAGIFVLAWVPFLISFALLVLRDPNNLASLFEFRNWTASAGALRVSTMLLLVVANDTFGYLVGALFGKHPMAPKISPKKSWEGFAGSVLGAAIVGVLAAIFLLQQPWWVGVLLALGMVAAATTGDLAESMVKRELGVKDMSSILPGHGGLMDRLDSILFAAPVAFLIYALLELF
ncbi:phosphatidate cytidylyltransferase [Psychromicrobium silvestre]